MARAGRGRLGKTSRVVVAARQRPFSPQSPEPSQSPLVSRVFRYSPNPSRRCSHSIRRALIHCSACLSARGSMAQVRAAEKIWRGTDGSNPSPSSGESIANPTFSIRTNPVSGFAVDCRLAVALEGSRGRVQHWRRCRALHLMASPGPARVVEIAVVGAAIRTAPGTDTPSPVPTSSTRCNE